MSRLFLLVLAVTLAAPPTAAASALTPSSASASASGGMGPEQQILDAYLRPYDRAPDLPYCARIAPGGEEPDELPPLPMRQVNGTNALMDEHEAWHTRHVSMAGTAPFDDENTYGIDFVMMHRMALAAYDGWRVEHGHEPVAIWDPSKPIPDDFRYALPDACAPRKTDDPAVPLPTWLTVQGGTQRSPMFNVTKLCDLPSMNRLGKELDQDGNGDTAYHGQVHGGVGGDMNVPQVSMRDPVFWAWHKWLDTRVQLWETACAHRAPLDPMTYMDGMGDTSTTAPFETTSAHAPPPRGVPGAPLPLALGTLALAALVAARVRRTS